MTYFPPGYELQFEAVRSRGPGGQNVNKTNSAAILRWNIMGSSCPEATKIRLLEKLSSKLTVDGDLLIRSEESRDLETNKKNCVAKLKTVIAQALFRPKKRIATKPSRSAKEKRLKSKKLHSERKSDRTKRWT